jgi:acetate kinase
MKVLVFNLGSSSIKYRLFDMSNRSVAASGVLERIGEQDACLDHQYRPSAGSSSSITRSLAVPDHREGMRQINAVLRETVFPSRETSLLGIGHRMAHGGPAFREPALIDAKVLDTIRQLAHLAPLHNPAMLTGIEVALAQFPGVPQVAVFDTAYHQTLPPHAYRYALPGEFFHRFHVRRYGFHGTSFRFVARQAASRLGCELPTLNLIALHLGNGSSAAAIRGGISVDTSMGMTPLAGLVMGTRCGDLDPAVVFYLLRETGLSPERLEEQLNQSSGLRGICGRNDLREIQQRAAADDSDAQLALDMFVHSVKKYVGAYYAVLGRVDALVFTGGIGENSPSIRWLVCQDMEELGITLDPAKNQQCPKTGGAIHAAHSRVSVLVEPTDEQWEIAEQTLATIQASDRSHAGPSGRCR